MSTLRVNTLQNTSTTDGGISINNSGHVTVDGVAMPSAGPLSNRNLIINGAMQVAQRGTSQTSNGYGTVDRFFPSWSGGAVTTTQESLTSGDPYDEGFRNFARLTNTTSANGASNYRLLVQRIEAQNVAKSGWNYTSATSYVTLSFWIRSSVSQAFSVRLRSEDGTNQNYPMSTGTLTADTWTKITKTIPGNSNLAFDNDNGRGLRVEFGAFWGGDFTSPTVTLDTWAEFDSTARTTDMTNTWAGTTDATFDITGVQLEVGSVATPFEHRSYGDEFRKCLRYFQHYISSPNANATYVAIGIAANSSSARFCMALVDPMRATPSVTSTGCRADDQLASPYTLSSPSINAGTISTLYLQFTSSGMTGGRAMQLIISGSESVSFSAEL